MSAANLLNGVRVLDLSRVLAGPFCCQLLADLGADVVKVERPGAGDDTRHWGPPFMPGDGLSAYYVSCNRGKRSLALDLTHPQSAAVLGDLLRTADVLVENFLPSALEKFGLQPERVAAINPRLVRASISGYGRTGPDANTPCYDLAVQAAAGLMSITGEPDGQPMKVGVAITDVLTGLYAAVSVLAGLWDRDRRSGAKADEKQPSPRPSPIRGEGEVAAPQRQFDLSLADCTLAGLVNVVQGVLATGERPRRYGNAHPQIVPYEAFATADGFITLAIGNDGQWQRFCAAVARPDLAADSRFADNPARVSNRGVLIPLLGALLRERTSPQWIELLAAAEIPHAAVETIDQVVASPRVAARRMVQEVRDGDGQCSRVVSTPIHCDGEPFCSDRAPPRLGEHSREVLSDWLGYNKDRIAKLAASGAVAE